MGKPKMYGMACKINKRPPVDVRYQRRQRQRQRESVTRKQAATKGKEAAREYTDPVR